MVFKFRHKRGVLAVSMFQLGDFGSWLEEWKVELWLAIVTSVVSLVEKNSATSLGPRVVMAGVVRLI